MAFTTSKYQNLSKPTVLLIFLFLGLNSFAGIGMGGNPGDRTEKIKSECTVHGDTEHMTNDDGKLVLNSAKISSVFVNVDGRSANVLTLNGKDSEGEFSIIIGVLNSALSEEYLRGGASFRRANDSDAQKNRPRRTSVDLDLKPLDNSGGSFSFSIEGSVTVSGMTKKLSSKFNCSLAKE